MKLNTSLVDPDFYIMVLYGNSVIIYLKWVFCEPAG